MNSFCYQHRETPYYQIRICLQLVIEKPFCELLNIKLSKRQTPTPPEVPCKKGVLKSFTKFKGNYLCWSLFIAGDFFEKSLQHWCFFVKFANFFKTSILWKPENSCFCMDFFLELFQKFQNIFKSTNEKMLLVPIMQY